MSAQPSSPQPQAHAALKVDRLGNALCTVETARDVFTGLTDHAENLTALARDVPA